MNRAATCWARWAGLAPREQALVAGAAALVALALLWWIASARRSPLRTADAQHRALDAQLQHMRACRRRPRRMQAQPRQGPTRRMRQLEAAIRQQLGTSARYSIAGDRVTVTLTNAPDALAPGSRRCAPMRAPARRGQADRATRPAAGTAAWC
jgi:general secretion pathway protein M